MFHTKLTKYLKKQNNQHLFVMYVINSLLKINPEIKYYILFAYERILLKILGIIRNFLISKKLASISIQVKNIIKS